MISEVDAYHEKSLFERVSCCLDREVLIDVDEVTVFKLRIFAVWSGVANPPIESLSLTMSFSF